jgi:hypothetical protein
MKRTIPLALLLIPIAALGATPCVPAANTERVVAVRVTPPEGGLMSGVSLRLDYPSAKLSLPGDGDKIPAGTLTHTPPGALAAANDSDGAVRLLVAKAGEIPPGEVLRMRFERCEGAPDAVAGDFTCTVLEVSDPTSNLISGVTCTAVLP